MTKHQNHQRGRMAVVSFAQLAGALLGLLFGPAGAATSAVAATEKTPAASCAALATAAFPDTRITTAEAIPGGSLWKFPHSVFNVMAGPDPGTEAAFCRVAGVIGKEIRFEVWLPPQWNGRLLNVGNGGLTGAINYPAMAAALASGFATGSTDTGHVTDKDFFDADWIDGNPERLDNFTYLAHHRLAETSKRVVKAYYGKPEHHAYYSGCSSGGWQGLTEAQKYPEDYHGIIAGAPANNLVRLQTRKFWMDRLDREDPAGVLGKEQVELITTAARAACDRADGVADGLAMEPLACPFKPADLICKEGTNHGCLTPPQAARAAQIYGPARSPGGLDLYPGNAFLVPPLVVLPGAMQEPALLRIFPAPERTWTPETFDTDRDLPALRQRLDDKMAALKTDLTPFAKRGGKLLMYHGWHDALLSPYNTLAYRAGMNEAMAPKHFTGFQRLYMMPGVDHCAGGIGPDRADFIGAMVAWVEEGKAPETLLATGRRPDGTTQARPLCPFPQVARHSGQGATDDASHWRCVNP
jgi:feruloyl esterase